MHIDAVCVMVQKRDNPLWSPSSNSPRAHDGSDPTGPFSANAVTTPAADGTGSAVEDAAQDGDADSIDNAADADDLCGGMACMVHFSQLNQRLQQQSAVISATQVRCLKSAWRCCHLSPATSVLHCNDTESHSILFAMLVQRK